MDKNSGFKTLQPTAAEQIIRRIQFLNCQMVGFQQDLELATHHAAFAETALQETRGELEEAKRALVGVSAEA